MKAHAIKCSCHSVSKTFIQKETQAIHVLKDIDLDVRENEFLVLLGAWPVRKIDIASNYCRVGGAEYR